MIQGIVLSAAGGLYAVDTGEGVREAVLRGRLKTDRRKGERVVAGDRVELAPPAREDESWTIEAVAERESSLVRRAPGRAPRPKVIAANIDRVVIVFAASRPVPNLRMLDRFLVLAESSELEPVIVVNKIDEMDLAEAREIFAPYERIGYPVLYCSASEGTGVDALKDLLCGGVSALTGPSGVGKSSLLNRVQPGLGLRVGAISSTLNKGQHTTVTAELIRLECGGYVADTPGLREVGLWGVDEGELDQCFPEFEPYLGECRYGNSCSHSHEPGCAVAEAVGRDIDPGRYESYLRLLAGDEGRSS